MTETHTQAITKIKNKLALIEKSQNFDCNKILLLPEDMICEIKSYLEPELKFTRKFVILQELNSSWGSCWDVYRFLSYIPKKLIMSVLCSCGIYPSCVKSKYQKDEWCKFIHHQINNLFSIGKFRIRIDKLMEQHNYIYDNKEKVIDKWFKVILCFVSFKRYRAELEGKNKKTDTRLKVLKNTVIKIGKNL